MINNDRKKTLKECQFQDWSNKSEINKRTWACVVSIESGWSVFEHTTGNILPMRDVKVVMVVVTMMMMMSLPLFVAETLN